MADGGADAGQGHDSGPDDAGAVDAFAGCASDPYDMAPACGEVLIECVPERPWCCLEDLGFPEPDTGWCRAADSSGGAVYCFLAAEPGCPDHPELCADDLDGDSFSSFECGGHDCDDSDPEINPNAADDVEPGRWVSEGELEDSGSLVMLEGGGLALALLHTTGPAETALEWAVKNGEGWEVEEVDASGRASGPSVAVHGGMVSIAYGMGSLRGLTLQVARQSEGAWEVETAVPEGYIGEFALAGMPDGAEWIAYALEGSLWLATNRAGGWTSELLVPALDPYYGGPYVDLVVDANGITHLVHNLEPLAHLVETSDTTGSWQTTPIDGFLRARGIAAALDDLGVAHVAYDKSPLYDLGYAENPAGEWVAGTIARHLPPAPDTGAIWVGGSPAIATGPDGLVAVVAEGGAGPVFLWRSGDGPWAREQLAHAGMFPSIAIAPDGTIHVATTALFGGITVMALARDDLRRVDQNCDGVDGVDADGDGWASEESGGTDCDDTLRSVFPGAPEVPGDGIDQDCSGAGPR